MKTLIILPESVTDNMRDIITGLSDYFDKDNTYVIYEDETSCKIANDNGYKKIRLLDKAIQMLVSNDEVVAEDNIVQVTSFKNGSTIKKDAMKKNPMPNEREYTDKVLFMHDLMICAKQRIKYQVRKLVESNFDVIVYGKGEGNYLAEPSIDAIGNGKLYIYFDRYSKTPKITYGGVVINRDTCKMIFERSKVNG